jgi:CubicO group peptidase (beta-lactamase class C family)
MSGLLTDACERQLVPGAQLGLLRDGERLVVCAGGGVVSTTRFHAGSIAKAVTALVVLDAARRGEVDLDVPCSEQGEGLWDETPRQLLAQTTGRANLLPEPDEDLRAFVERTAALPRVHPPGRFSYGNAGWAVLDLLLEQRCGRGFEALAQERVLGGIGTFGMPAGAAGGHGVTAEGAVHPVPDVYAVAASAAGSRWWTTADELLDFAQLHLDDGAGRVNAADVRAMREPVAAIPGATVADHWGLGWDLWDGGAHDAFGWSGFTGGHRAYLRCFPSQRAALVVLANCAGSLFSAPGGAALFDDVTDDALGELGIDVDSLGPSAPPDPPLPVDLLVGRYGPLEVRPLPGNVADLLELDATAFGEPAPLRYQRDAGNRFVIPGRPAGSLPIAFDGDLLYLGPMAMPRS